MFIQILYLNHNKTNYELCLLLKLPYEFIPSISSQNLMFFEPLKKFGNMKSIFFHCKPYVECLKWPTFVCPFAGHLMSFASFALLNKRFNRGTTETYHKTFARGPLLLYSYSLSLCLYRDTSHCGHWCNLANSFLYKTQSFEHAWIFWYFIPIEYNIFFAS